MKHSEARTAAIRQLMSVPPARPVCLALSPGFGAVSLFLTSKLPTQSREIEQERARRERHADRFWPFKLSRLPVQVPHKTLADGGTELPEREAVEREFQ